MGRPPGRPAAGPRPSGPGSGSPAEAGQLRLKPDAGGRAGTQGGGRQVCSARPRSGSRASQAGTEGAPRGSQRGRPPSPQPHFLSRAGRRPWQGGRNCSAPALPPAACTRPGRRRPPSPECSRQKRPRTSRAGRERGDQDGGREAETPAPAQRGGRWGGGGRGRGRGEGGGGAAGRAGPGAPPPPSPQPGLRCHLEAWAQTQGGVPVARKLGPNPRWPSVPGQQAGLTEGSACTCSGRVGEARAAADRGRGWGLGRVATGTIGRGGRCWQAAGPSPTSHCLGEAAPAVLGMPLPAGGAVGLGSASTCQIKSLHL